MDGFRDRRVIGRAAAALALLALLVLGACHPQEPPGKRDASAGQPLVPPREPY